MKKIILVIVVAVTFLLTSCSAKNYTYVEGKINIVATTTMIGDLANQVGGDFVSVTTLMSVGVDPHLYQPKASDTTALLKADLIIINGLHLEGQMGEVLENVDASKLLIIGDYLNKDELIHIDKDTVDPHIWFNVLNWKLASAAVTKKLIEMDSDNTTSYQTMGDNYLVELEELHQYVLSKVAELEESQRVLVTAHDAFNYFGQTYGFDVYAIQGISTESEASVNDISSLAKLVKKLDVKAIFVESSISKATINSVIEASELLGHSLIIGGELYSDSLGDVEHDSETYIKTVKNNVDTIVDALK